MAVIQRNGSLRKKLLRSNNPIKNKRTSIELVKHLKATSQSIDSNDDLVRQANIVGIDLLKFLKLKLDYNYSLDVPDKLVSNIDVEKPLVKRNYIPKKC